MSAPIYERFLTPGRNGDALARPLLVDPKTITSASELLALVSACGRMGEGCCLHVRMSVRCVCACVCVCVSVCV
jgi:hypothetical protein